MCFNKVEGPKTLRRHTLVKKSITQITEDFIKKSENIQRRRKTLRDRRSILFSYGQVEFERTYYKKASGGYEYLADTAVV